MIGNDIVDLAQAKQESNWRRRGFLDKIFTQHEQQLILEANDSDRMVWLLWSMKESAYKLSVRSTGLRLFAPKKIACFVNGPTTDTTEGTVFYTREYHTKSSITAQYIATVAYEATIIPAYTHVIVPFDNTIYQTHQRVIREQIKHRCAARLAIPEQAIHIHKDSAGTPLLTVDNVVKIPLTISHHGYYGAYALGLI
ncbi:4'-phosphopantetheinyl transferase family protein [Spirosoma flavum]|uniref:4'-phosphopantetheinyl transferase superfamily protein n=1 Tax=Spirosoma flavum TaxID=2048557 RepID=A0ABW6AMR6_9BACT